MIGGRGGVGAFWLLLWISSWAPLKLVIPVAGQAGLHCVNFDQNNYHGDKGGYSTIGAKRFKPVHHQGMSRSSYQSYGGAIFQRGYGKCPNGFAYHWFYWQNMPNDQRKLIRGLAYDNPWMDFCGKGVKITTSLVEQHGRVLRGWLHFEVEIDSSLLGAAYILAEMRDEKFQTIGEFVTSEDEQCGTKRTGIISPTQYQYLPCSAISPREAKPSQAIFMASHEEYENLKEADPYIQSSDLKGKKGIHFTWRMGEYWCNRHEMIRLDVQVLPNRNITGSTSCPTTSIYIENGTFSQNHDYHLHCRSRRVTTQWMIPKWFGAADIKLDGPLSCTAPVFENETHPDSKLSQAASAWLLNATEVTFGNDYAGTHKNFFCQVNGSYQANQSSFGGRCAKDMDKTAPVDKGVFQACSTNESSPALKDLDFPSYTKYLKDLLFNRSQLCTVECRMPSTQNDSDLLAIQSFPTKNVSREKKKPKISYETVRAARTEQRGNTLFFTRKFHGNLCIFITIFLLSVSNFIIRYYKETFMDHLSLGCAPWFWFHMFACFWIPVLYLSGHASMEQSIENFGESKSVHAIVHRTVGKFFAIVFCLMVALGAFRPLFRGARMLSMAVHSVTGFVLYFLAIGLIINSAFIPGSPTLDHCDDDGLPEGFSFTAWMAVAWLIIDMAFHFLLTIFQFAIDRRYEIVRAGVGLPFVPLLPAEAPRDLVGAKFRKLVLAVYVSLSLIMTLATMIALFLFDVEDQEKMNCVLGEMTCNLSEVRPNQDSSPFGCSNLAKKYYNKGDYKVIAKYQTIGAQ